MSKTRRMPDTITGRLRWHLEHCGANLVEVEQETGIHNSMLSRFVRGERGLHLDNIDLLGEYLGLRLARDVG